MTDPRSSRSPPSAERAAAFLPRIEALRGFGALAVAWCHATMLMSLAAGHPVQGVARLTRSAVSLSLWVMNGRAALIVFFVISGLVLGLMLDAASPRGAVRGYVAFLARRAFRIYPAHWAALLLFVPAAAFILFAIPVADPAFLTRVDPKWWFDGTVYGHLYRWELVRTAIFYDQFYNAVAWSLRVEMEACLFIPFLVWLTRRRSLVLDLVSLAFLVAIAALVDPSVRPDAVFLYLPAFHLGALAGTHGPRIAAALGRWRGATIAALLLSYLVLTLPAALTRYADVRLWVVLDMSAGAFGLVLLIAWARLGRLDALFLNRISRSIGRLSYSFYLWHWLVLAASMRTLLILFRGPVLAGPLNTLLFFATAAITILLSLAIAAVSYRWVERPFMILGRSLADRIASGSRPAGADVPLAAEAATAP